LRWNMPSWSISTEWAAYLLTPVLFYIFLYQRQVISFAAMFIFFSVLYLITVVNGNIDATYNYGVPRCVIEYSLGLLAYRLYSQFSRTGSVYGQVMRRALPMVLLSVVVSVFVFCAELPSILLFAVSVLGLALSEGTLTGKIFSSKFLIFFGRISYSLYLIHMLVISDVVPLLVRTSGYRDRMGFWALLPVDLVLSVAFAALLFYTVERPTRIFYRRLLLGSDKSSFRTTT
jgi:peptidoglycan/LPS O-acetylase OafA/YrhL